MYVGERESEYMCRRKKEGKERERERERENDVQRWQETKEMVSVLWHRFTGMHKSSTTLSPTKQKQKVKQY